MKNLKMKNKFRILNIFNIIILLTAISSPLFAQTPITTDSRIRTLVYNPNEVYELKFFYNYQSFIEFSGDEEIEMISIGEAFAWRLTPAGKRLFIRPLEIAAHTNMTIITNKRTYHFDIRSDEYSGKADEDLVYTIRFFYPQIGQPLPIPPQLAVPNIAPRISNQPIPKPRIEEIVRTPTPQTRIDEPLPSIIERNPEGAELNFDYRVAGKSDDIMPLKVYDDGAETHLQFANDNLVIPTISMVDSSGSEIPLTYVVRDRYVVIPTISRQFTLRLSDGLLCIFNNKLIDR
jgi:type IV secretion system protein VirB9